MPSLPSPTQEARATAAPDPAAKRLLQAAETVLIRHGGGAISVRALTSEAKCNVSLVSYHFGGLNGLLEQVAEDNLLPMLELREDLLRQAARAVDPQERLHTGIEAHARPMWLPSSHAGLPTAGALMSVLMPLLSGPTQQQITGRVQVTVDASCAVLLPLLPQLDKPTLLMRLRLLLGAVHYLQPGHWSAGMFTPGASPVPADDTLDHLLRFAAGALHAP
jgi:AcrR family transcriptional regulator